MFRTYEPARDRLAAVKVFRLDLTPEQARALADELQRLVDAGLAHPSIVAPIAAGVEGGTAYLAEEYVAAESLDIAIRHYAPASLDKALPFIAQLAGAIDFARAAGIGHGTLHPRDIFLTPDEARATGFGIAGALEAVGLRAPVRRPYSAPERVAGERWGPAADVFTLGAVAYELLTARRIAGAVGPSDTLELRGADSPVARLLAGPLARALAEGPAARYPGALPFARALEAAAEGGGPDVPGVPEVARVQPSLVDALDAERDGAEPESPALDDFSPDELAGTGALPPPSAAPALDLDLKPVREPEPVFVQPQDRPEPRQPQDLGELRERRPPREPRELRKPLEPLELLEPQEPEPPERLEPREPTEPTEPLEPSALLESLERREPMRLFPMSLMLVAGLLVGFVAGYAVGTRGQPDGATRAAAPAAGEAWSEAKVDPPAAPAPAPTDAPAPARESAATPVPTSGTIVVRSTPERAGVVIDGAWRGRTPLTLSDLALGRHTVRVAERGYAARETQVTLSAERSRTEVEITLPRVASPAPPPAVRTPARPPPPPAGSRRASPSASAEPSSVPEKLTGSVYVDSRPRGARVFLDGRAVGTTPVQIPDVPIGSHVVRLELPGHRTWTAAARVGSGQNARVTGSLEPVP